MAKDFGISSWLLATLLVFLIPRLRAAQSGHLDSVASPSPLNAPTFQAGVKGTCYSQPQTHYGPMVDQWGHGLYYGAAENVSQAKQDVPHPGAAFWRTPGIEFPGGGKCCEKLSEVRDYIDYIDETILKYLALRQQFVLEAGRFKDSKQAVRSVDRAVAVVAGAEKMAAKFGLAPWIANITFTAAVNSFAQLELCQFDEDVGKPKVA